MSERFWIHCNPAGDGSQGFEVLSEALFGRAADNRRARMAPAVWSA